MYFFYGAFAKRSTVIEPPCVFIGDSSVWCRQTITHLNTFLLTVGLPLTLTSHTSDSVGIFLINDEGNIDKWSRPLRGGFTIEFIPPEPVTGLAVPIAAIVVLPVIAAVTAAAIAAAWLVLGQRAQEYVGASFDAFAVSPEGGCNASPLYDAKGLECTSALYQGDNASQ